MISRKEYIDQSKQGFISHLKRFVEIPSVSMLPEHKKDIRAAAVFAADLLTSFGLKADVTETSGNPVVTASGPFHPDWPTITIYNHIDVQPGNEPEWKTDPFVLSVDGDTFTGRGSTDDKGPALTALYAARYAIESRIPVNLKFIWELEEEIGSPSFEEFLLKKKKDLVTDSVLVSDTIWLNRQKPSVPYGLRGLQTYRLILETGEKDCHSGLCGGAARNPIAEMALLLSQLHDAHTGDVHIPGFYDDVRKPKKREIVNFIESGFDPEKFKKAHGLKSLRYPNPGMITTRIWALPTFEVHGIVGGYTGPGVKTAIPPRVEAKISTRLVPDQTPDKITRLLKKAVKELNDEVKVIPEGGLVPYLGDFEGFYAEAAVKAIEHAFGTTPAFTREGGSIGAVVTMQKHLKVPINFLGLSLPEHGYHAPNENYDWQQASGGMSMFLKYFDILGEAGKKKK
ncbi:MAG: M20/M25/M40 family metallo-hydrolase [Bacteroidetes bacterium]|nr:M20/M25/M40 family metallo-hydrolase [Bacteroidota bacterium]